MADSVTTLTVPACPAPTCGAIAGVSHCYTATGFPRPMHAVRVAAMQALAAGADSTPTAEPAAGRHAHRRPSPKQASILARAIRDGGFFELSGYGFAGETQNRKAVQSMVDDSRGWMRHVRETQHGTLYEITNEGRNAEARYRDWTNGANR